MKKLLIFILFIFNITLSISFDIKRFHRYEGEGSTSKGYLSWILAGVIVLSFTGGYFGCKYCYKRLNYKKEETFD
uniref:Uncharacterized protein n=1 Tax=Strongyloides stercoralis TaxID=6248 RepID=A0A0K0EJW9_STRER